MGHLRLLHIEVSGLRSLARPHLCQALKTLIGNVTEIVQACPMLTDLAVTSEIFEARRFVRAPSRTLGGFTLQFYAHNQGSSEGQPVFEDIGAIALTVKLPSFEYLRIMHGFEDHDHRSGEIQTKLQQVYPAATFSYSNRVNADTLDQDMSDDVDANGREFYESGEDEDLDENLDEDLDDGLDD